MPSSDLSMPSRQGPVEVPRDRPRLSGMEYVEICEDTNQYCQAEVVSHLQNSSNVSIITIIIHYYPLFSIILRPMFDLVGSILVVYLVSPLVVLLSLSQLPGGIVGLACGG